MTFIRLGENENIAEDKKIVLIWTDIMLEHQGAIEAFKKEYEDCTIAELIAKIKRIIKLQLENKPFRGRVEVSCTEEYDLLDNEFVVYESENIDYKELLLSLFVLLNLMNIEDRPYLIIDLVMALKMVDEKIADRFYEDIAAEVYWEYR